MKNKIGYLFILIFTWHIGIGQINTGSESFANFLYTEKEFNFASQEFERLYFQYPDSLHFFKMWVSSSRLAGHSERVLSRVNMTSDTPFEIKLEYCKSAIQLNKLSMVKSVLNESLTETDTSAINKIHSLKTGIGLIENYLSVDKKDLSNAWLRQFHADYDQQNKKNSVISGLCSALVPGLGRVYTGDHTNAILSFLFVAGSSYQAYSRFQKFGKSSVSGWIYGGIACGFYIGNIYGSVKSAKAYNKRKKSQIDEKVKSRLYLL